MRTPHTRAYVVFVFALVAFVCFLAAHPKFDVFIHQDAASSSSTVLLTSLSSARRGTVILSAFAHMKLPVLDHGQFFPATDSAFCPPEAVALGSTPYSHPEILLI